VSSFGLLLSKEPLPLKLLQVLIWTVVDQSLIFVDEICLLQKTLTQLKGVNWLLSFRALLLVILITASECCFLGSVVPSCIVKITTFLFTKCRLTV